MEGFKHIPGGEIMALYPGLFQRALLSPTESCLAFGLECGEGWWPIIDRMCQAIVKVTDSVQLEQVKSKFGTLRVYWATTRDLEDNAMAKIRLAIEQAEAESARTCESCGAPGRSTTISGWLSTLCPWHEAQRLRVALDEAARINKAALEHIAKLQETLDAAVKPSWQQDWLKRDKQLERQRELLHKCLGALRTVERMQVHEGKRHNTYRCPLADEVEKAYNEREV